MRVEGVPTPVKRRRRCHHVVASDAALETKVDFERIGYSQQAIVAYFVRVTALVGCSRDMYVVSRAWQLCCAALAASCESGAILAESPSRTLVACSCIGGVGADYKAVIIGALALAVDVTADFEADYVLSGLAWGHLLFCEISGVDCPTDPVALGLTSASGKRENARQLMRMKLVIAQALGWRLRDPSPADSFALLLSRLTSCGCHSCLSAVKTASLVAEFIRPVLEALSYVLGPRGVDAAVIGGVALTVARESFASGAVTTSAQPAGLKRTLATVRRSVERNGLNPCIQRLDAGMVDNVTRILLDRELHAELELVLSAPAEAKAVLREIEEAVQNDALDLVDTENNY